MPNILLPFLVFFPMLASFAVYPLRHRDRKYRDLYIRVIPGIELFCALLLPLLPAPAALPALCGLGLYFAAGSLRTLMAILAAFLWMMTALTCREYFAGTESCNRFYLFFLMTLGATMGVFLAADLFTLFVFFEIMSFTSFVWVAQRETPEAISAGNTYLAVAVAGGMALLAGLLLLQHLFGTLQIDALAHLAESMPSENRGELTAAGLLCLTGFGAKAGIFPLHIWLPKAYPAAPAPGTVLLSSVLSKSGFFGIAILSANLFCRDTDWNMLVLTLALITMVLGAVLALLTSDLKRALACSSMSQYGFILLGIAMQGFLGEHNALAVRGTVLHMLNHSLIKLVLFVAAGVIYLGARSLDLNEIRGWGRNKPWLGAAFLIGAASIAGLPPFSGYASKALLHESIVEYIHLLEKQGAFAGNFHAVEWLFLVTGGLTVAYTTKLFAAIFMESRTGGQRPAVREYMSRGTQVVLGCGAAAIAILGLTQSLTMEWLGAWGGKFLHAAAPEETFHYFSLANLEGTALSAVIGAAVYLLLVQTLLRKRRGEEIYYPDLWPQKLELERIFYRPVLRGLAFFGALCARLAASLGDLIVLAGETLLFSRAPGHFEPKRDQNFGAYGRKPLRFLVTETFSFDLMLAGAGLLALLFYILLK